MSDEKWPAPNMMLVTSNWAQIPSFNLIPIDTFCPYIECLFNPMGKVLAIVGKTKKDKFQMVPRLDTTGTPEVYKGGKDEKQPYKMQRIQQDTYTEYYITDKAEVENFIKRFAVNHEEFDYKMYLDKETMSDPGQVEVPQSTLIVE